MKRTRKNRTQRLGASSHSEQLSSQPHLDRKAMQLCSQVRHALEYAISEALEGKRGITVSRVVPAPNTSHLLVFVQALEVLTLDELTHLQAEISKHASSLRTSVSQAIHRKRTPGLTFQVIPCMA